MEYKVIGNTINIKISYILYQKQTSSPNFTSFQWFFLHQNPLLPKLLWIQVAQVILIGYGAPGLDIHDSGARGWDGGRWKMKENRHLKNSFWLVQLDQPIWKMVVSIGWLTKSLHGKWLEITNVPSGKNWRGWLEYPHFQLEIYLPSRSNLHCYVGLPE